MRLIDGAEAIRGDLPASATRVVDIPLGAGESLGTGVHRFTSLTAIRDLASAELGESTGPVITIGGDCASDLAGIAHALGRRGRDSVALLWLDAHADLNDAESSPSGAFHGMVVRALLGDAPDELALGPDERLAADHLVLAGTRALDDGESAFVAENSIRVVGIDELSTTDALLAALDATGATSVYVHIDLDVLDPATISGIGYPEPFGLQPEQLGELVRAVRGRFELAGAAITEFAPESPDAASRDLPVILRVLGALTGPLG